jgi:hypothetical protein
MSSKTGSRSSFKQKVITVSDCRSTVKKAVKAVKSLHSLKSGQVQLFLRKAVRLSKQDKEVKYFEPQ